MESIWSLLICLSGGAFFLLILSALIKYFSDYSAEARFIKSEIACAENSKDLAFYKTELKVMRLCLIPGLTPERVLRLFNKKDNASKSDGITAMLLPAVVGIIVCSVCLTTATYAWFTASVSTSAQTIKAADYSAEIEITSESEDITPENTDNGYTFTLPEGESTIKITAAGTASTGYCVIQSETDSYHTKQLAPGQTLSVKINVASETDFTLRCEWGSYSGEPYFKNDGDSLTLSKIDDPAAPDTDTAGQKLSPAPNGETSKDEPVKSNANSKAETAVSSAASTSSAVSDTEESLDNNSGDTAADSDIVSDTSSAGSTTADTDDVSGD